jgi:hypothetical protein
MINVVQSWIHTLEDTCHFGSQMSHLSVQTKTWQFLQTCIITFKNKYNICVFYRWIIVLSFYSFIERLYSDVSSALLISLNFPFLSVLSFFNHLAEPVPSWIRISLDQDQDLPFPTFNRINEGSVYCGVQTRCFANTSKKLYNSRCYAMAR